jgi:hypothetical protein
VDSAALSTSANETGIARYWLLLALKFAQANRIDKFISTLVKRVLKFLKHPKQGDIL